MAEAKLFSIGEVAKLFHVSVSSLRHYEAAGLLQPEYISPDSGYRHYSTRQFEVLNTLRYLRALGMPLHEIADFLQNRNLDSIEQKLCQQKAAVAEKQRELSRIERKIDRRLRQLQSAKTAELDKIELVVCPACRLVWVEDALNIRGFLDMEAPIRRLEQAQPEAVVCLGKVGLGISEAHLRQGLFTRYDRIFLALDEEDRFVGETHELPEMRCVRVRFRGSHPQAAGSYARLLAYIRENGFAVCGFSREITLIDYGLTDDPAQFVTEISIPVEPA